MQRAFLPSVAEEVGLVQEEVNPFRFLVFCAQLLSLEARLLRPKSLSASHLSPFVRP